MSNFNWTQVGNTCYQARVGEFLAEVYGSKGGWQFWFAGTAYDRYYDTKEIAMMACQIYSIHWIVNACEELGFAIRLTS